MLTLSSVLAQTLPPIQSQSTFDLVNFLVNAVAALLWRSWRQSYSWG